MKMRKDHQDTSVSETEIQEEATAAKEVEEVDNTPIAVPGTNITEKELDALKKQYKKIFKTSFIDDVFIWHRLDRRTFSDIIANTAAIEDEEEKVSTREQEFIKAALVYPEINDDFIGFLKTEDIIVTGLAEEILYRSGFVPPKTEQI